MAETWGIILAAGESKRMQELKLLLPFGDRTILDHTLDNVLGSKVSHVLVVLGYEADRMMGIIGARNVSVTINDDFRDGMLSSIKCGFRSLPPDAEAALVYLADQPMIPPQVTNTVLSEWKTKRAGLVVPVYNGRRGHPLLVDLKYRKDVMELKPEIGLRELLRKFPDDLVEVKISDRSILEDIDTREDYMKMIAKNN